MEKSQKKRDRPTIRHEATHGHLGSSSGKLASDDSERLQGQDDAAINIAHKFGNYVTTAGDTKVPSEAGFVFRLREAVPDSWTCPECVETFPGAFPLTEHLVRCHLSACRTCADVFHDRTLLERHLAIVHGVRDAALSWRLIEFWTELKQGLSQPHKRRRKPKPRAEGKRVPKVLPRSKGIDSDPFMRCFLREVDTNQESSDRSEGDAGQLSQDGNVLYLYPLVEYETQPRGYPEEMVPKVEVFYRHPDDGETSGSSEDEPSGYSPEDSEEDVDRCVLCKAAFSDKGRLQAHMVSTHIDEEQNGCEVCGRRFDTVFKARSHVMMEHVDVRCKCCQRVFTRSTSLRRHMVTHCGPHDRPPSAYKLCEVCLKSFPTSTGLADHVETEHAALLEHRCDLCDRTFLTEDELFVHVDRDPHVCLLCSTHFESTLSLRQHLLGHATDRQVLELFT